MRTWTSGGPGWSRGLTWWDELQPASTTRLTVAPTRGSTRPIFLTLRRWTAKGHNRTAPPLREPGRRTPAEEAGAGAYETGTNREGQVRSLRSHISRAAGHSLGGPDQLHGYAEDSRQAA